MLFDRIDYIDIVINEIQNHLAIFRIVKIIHAMHYRCVVPLRITG